MVGVHRKDGQRKRGGWLVVEEFEVGWDGIRLTTTRFERSGLRLPGSSSKAVPSEPYSSGLSFPDPLQGETVL
jgi:hypothetical protein